MFISRPTDDIAYAIAYTNGNLLRLDNLQFGSSTLGEATAKTNFEGSYSFNNLAAGTYDVATVERIDWSRTTPTIPAGHTVTVSSVDTTTGLDFGFATLNSTQVISGVIYHDYNHEGNTKERFEQGVAGRRVYADQNSNGAFDNTEPTAITNEWGGYDLRVFATGLFNVRAVTPAGWSQTFPENDAPRSVLVNGVDTIVDMNFGVRRNNVPFTPGNILVNRSSWVTTDMLLELNRDGEILQGISVPGTEDFSRTRIQDLAIDSNGDVQFIVHSDAGNSLRTYHQSSGTFSTLNIP